MNYDQPLFHSRRLSFEKHIRTAKIDNNSTNSSSNDNVNKANRSQNVPLLFKYINDNIIGKYTTVNGPFGRKSGNEQ